MNAIKQLSALSKTALAGATVAAALGAAPFLQDPTRNRLERLPLKAARTLEFETTEGTFMNMDVSPDGKTILFDILGNLFTVPITGGEAKQLTRDLGYDIDAVWSPDGKRIAYVTDMTGSDNVWIMDADGSNAFPLTAVKEGRFSRPEWTPDGKYIMANGRLFHVAGGELPLPAELSGTFRFSADGKYAYVNRSGIRRVDRQSGKDVQLANPALRYDAPVVSPDGKWLTYVAFAEGSPHAGLRVRNLASGADEWLAFPIEKRRINVERYEFTDDSKHVIIGYGGKIHRIDVATKKDEVIPFTAKMKVDVGPFAYHQYRVTNDSLVVQNTRSANQSPDGTTLVFSALARVYTMSLPNGTPKVLVEQPEGQFQPVYSPDGKWIAYVTWSDVEGGAVWRIPATGGKPERITKVTGHYQRPAWSPDGSLLAILKDESESMRNIWSRPSGELLILTIANGAVKKIADDVPLDNQITFTSDGKRILFLLGSRLISARLDGSDRRGIATVAGGATQVVPSPDGRYLAYEIREDLYLAPLAPVPDEVMVGDSTSKLPVVQLTRAGGMDPRWENGGKTLTWAFANNFYRANPDRIMQAREQASLALAQRGIDADTAILEVTPDETIRIDLKAPRHYARGQIAFTNARIITMNKQLEVIENGTIVIKDDRILAVGPAGSVQIPKGTTVMDAKGKTIMPGMQDMHAHLRPSRDVFVQNWFAYLANLAYGVTTTRDVSTSNDAYGYFELVEVGRMVGPRIYNTGRAMTTGNARIRNYQDAYGIVSHYKAMGTPVIKQYMQPFRRQRQWVHMAANELKINVTNEGGGDTRLDLSMVLDGFAGWEHALPEANLYHDVKKFVAMAKTWYTPTLLVAYGGPQGEEYFFDKWNTHDDPKIRRFMPHEEVDRRTLTGALQREEDEPHFIDVSRHAADMLKLGGNVTMGGHGEYQGIQCHWEMWGLQMGGLSNMDALRTATILGAEALGMQQDLGSLEVGKIADLIVLDKNPLEDIKNSIAIVYVMKNGELYDGNTLDVLWPKKRPMPAWKFRDFGPPEVTSKAADAKPGKSRKK